MDSNVALSGQWSADKEKKKGDLTGITCYGCEKKGPMK